MSHRLASQGLAPSRSLKPRLAELLGEEPFLESLSFLVALEEPGYVVCVCVFFYLSFSSAILSIPLIYALVQFSSSHLFV